MSLGHGAKTITDKLLFAYDMGSKQSFKGMPTTNLVNQPTSAFSNWSGLTGSSTEYTTKNGRQGVHLIVLTSGGVNWYNTGGQKVVTPSTQYTVSATINYSGGTPHPNLFYIRQYNSSGSQTSEGGKFSSSSMISLGNGWYRAYRTFTTDSTAVKALVQGYEYTAPRDIYIEDVQLELGGITSPYVDGTRSNTESLLDWKGNNTITSSSLTYASDNTFSFNGSSNFIQVPSPLPDRYNWTIEFVAKQNAYVGGQVVLCPSSAGIDQSIRFNSSGQLYAGFTRIADNNSFAVTASGASSVGEWAHYVVQRTPSNVRIYRNGVLEADSTQAGISAEWSGTWRIGQRGNSTGWLNGQIAIMRAYDKMLSANEVKINFNAIRGRFGI